MSNNIKITKEIPAPPEGFAVEERYPKANEPFCTFVTWKNAWEERSPHKVDQEGHGFLIFAYRISKKKRLMTPQELAGKWVWIGGSGAIVCGIDIQEGKIHTHKTSLTVFEAKLHGWSWSDTPTSEPRSLEVDDDR